MPAVSVVKPDQADNLIKAMKGRKETTVRVQPLNKNLYSFGENMKLRLSDDGYVDFSKSYWSFKITGANSVAATTLQLTPNAESIFRTIVVTTENGQVMEDYNHRDVLLNGMIRHTMGSDAHSSERSVMSNVRYSGGLHTGALSGDRAASFSVSLGPFATTANHLGFFGSSHLYPMKYMGQLLFDVDFVDARNFIESFITATGASASATETATIADIEFVYVSVQYGDEFDALVKEQINSDEGMLLQYDTFESHVDATSNVSGELTSKINLASSSLKGIYTLFRGSDAVTVHVPNTTVPLIGYQGGHNYRFGYGAINALLDTYNYQINNRHYPSFNASIGKHAYPELLKSLSRFGDVSKGSLVSSLEGLGWHSYLGGNIALNGSIQSGAFMLGVNLEEQNQAGLMSGIDTKGNLDISLKLSKTSVIPLVINHFSHVDRILRIRPNNECEVKR